MSHLPTAAHGSVPSSRLASSFVRPSAVAAIPKRHHTTRRLAGVLGGTDAACTRDWQMTDDGKRAGRSSESTQALLQEQQGGSAADSGL